MLNKYKAQSALEFLTTYGWAFLIILIMIGALAYFGILSPSKLLPNRCNFGAEWECIDYQVTAGTVVGGGTVKLRIKSSLGDPVTIQNIAVGTAGVSNSLYCTTAIPAIVGDKITISNIRSGQSIDITWSVCGMATVGILPGEKTKINVTVDYYSVTSGSGYLKQSRGEIYTGAI